MLVLAGKFQRFGGAKKTGNVDALLMSGQRRALCAAEFGEDRVQCGMEGIVKNPMIPNESQIVVFQHTNRVFVDPGFDSIHQFIHEFLFPAKTVAAHGAPNSDTLSHGYDQVRILW